ncbi:hypothetical protein LEM8419_01510 [Neolewinella maritima]|uniref:Glycosyltransferase 2-like domain-containing protein n=1 Tax=Neolewinella maritima TaxID=1383882 RepID=A0ABN8F7S4_9BACT|nr:glycosyltransferase [Neolewinella maritima]CAH1000357.1 hypothetical protein LEM8419_01510 [Neolewinella maritima]
MEFLLIGTVGVCVLAVLHTYVLYPWRTTLQARQSSLPRQPELPITDWPTVRILMAVHNEERVLGQKLATLAAQDYRGPLHLMVADDQSTDRTPQLLRTFEFTGPRRQFTHTRNTRRSGKPATINRLAGAAGAEGIFVLTDASVLLRPDTITELVRPLVADPGLGVVDSRVVHTGMTVDGIGRSEDRYINQEVHLKQAESHDTGYFIGPFGGCWAIRAAAYTAVPDNFLVDDFFLCMSAYRAGWRGYSSDRAVVLEGVGQRLPHEFRRKVRIGSGNWQNLLRFQDLWWPPTQNALAYAFFCHKVLRWLTPLFVCLAVLCLLLLWQAGGNYWAGLLLKTAGGIALSTIVLDLVLGRLGLHVGLLRNLHYFMAMNAALLVGFVRYLTGIKTNVWQPSYRPPNDSAQ